MKPFTRAYPTRDGHPLPMRPGFQMWQNDTYVVIRRDRLDMIEHPTVTLPHGWTWLSVRRQDREWPRDWRDLQEIKNLLCGPEREAVEIFPAESRLVDCSNQLHLWVLPEGVSVGVGYGQREVLDQDAAAREGATQRPLGDAP